MPATGADVVHVRIIGRYEGGLSEDNSQVVDHPELRVYLEMPNRSSYDAEFDLQALQNELNALEPIWLSKDPEKTGRILYNYLFPDELSFHYGAALNEAKDRGIQLRLELDNRAPTLHLIPWERLYQPSMNGWVSVTANPHVYFSRFIRTGNEWGLPAGAGMLRALIAISSPYPAGHELYVDVEKEYSTISAVLDRYGDRIQYELVEDPVNLENIMNRLDAEPGYDIFHFIGHGQWRPDEEMAYLVMEKATADGVKAEGVPADSLLNRLPLQRHMPRLIILTACESAQHATGEALVGLAPQLVQQGCPSVIAMQDLVEQKIARRFSEIFYAELLDHGFIDQAVNRGRSKIMATDSWQWTLPVLFMRRETGALFLPSARFAAARIYPYKFLAPYTVTDQKIFAGRDKLAERVFNHILERPVTVLHGRTGVGMTSLMEAGVRPKLEEANALTIVVSEYHDLRSEVRMRVRVEDKPLQLRISGDAPLSEVLLAILTQGFNLLILVLDQFEQALRLDSQEQEQLFRSLANSQEQLGNRLRLVFAVHTDQSTGLAAAQSQIQGLNWWWEEVPLLDEESATQAIVNPLKAIDSKVQIKPEFARSQIVKGLNRLYSPVDSSVEDTTIDPGLLQIICTWLYEQARERDYAVIDDDLYARQAGGAEGILVRYMKDTLRTQLADEQVLAEKILIAMSEPEAEIRVTAESLNIDGYSPDRVESVLERLARLELLRKRSIEGKTTYAFINERVRQEAFNLGGDDLKHRYQAGGELERMWRLWVAATYDTQGDGHASDRALLTTDQLHFLAGSGEHLNPTPVKALMLLRSAVFRQEIIMQPWLAWWQTPQGKEFLQLLTSPARDEMDGDYTDSDLDKARRLLRIDDVEDTTVSDIVSHTAIHHSDSVTRRTAVLALTALRSQEELVDQTESALVDEAPDLVSVHLAKELQGLDSKWLRWRRGGEVWATLLDAQQGPTYPMVRSALDRFGIWLWRSWRRIVHDKTRLLWLILGGAVGAGLMLATLRALISIPATSRAGAMFGIFFFYGFILGAGVSTGVLLAEYFMLLKPPLPGSTVHPSPWRKPLITILLGALFFGLAHFFVALLNGIHLIQSFLVVVLGFVAGLGLSASLLGQPEASMRRNIPGWLLRVGVSAFSFLLTQVIFLIIGSRWANTLAIGLSSGFYESEFSIYARQLWPQLLTGDQPLFTIFALLDAALVGIMLTVGITLGMRWAAKWLARNQTLS